MWMPQGYPDSDNLGASTWVEGEGEGGKEEKEEKDREGEGVEKKENVGALFFFSLLSKNALWSKNALIMAPFLPPPFQTPMVFVLSVN